MGEVTPLDEELVAEMKRVHGAHTVILYGSRARGDANDESDVDVAAFAHVAETTRDARPWNGTVLDAFVYPTAVAAAPAEELLKLVGGVTLLDVCGLAAPLMQALDALDAAGPPPLPESELRVRRVWARKMLARVRRGDVEAHYRRHWLLFQLLEDHFALRGVWFRGPKVALATLRIEAPETFALFERALAPGAPDTSLELLVEHVVG